MKRGGSGGGTSSVLLPSYDATSFRNRCRMLMVDIGTESRAPSALSIRAKTSKDFRSDTSGPSTPVQARGMMPKSALRKLLDQIISSIHSNSIYQHSHKSSAFSFKRSKSGSCQRKPPSPKRFTRSRRQTPDTPYFKSKPDSECSLQS